MAGILDALGTGDIGAARQETEARNRARRDKIAQLIAEREGPAAGVGAAFGAGFGGGLADAFLPQPDSPDVIAAKETKAIMDQVAGIEHEVNSPEYFTAQAEILQNSGRTDLALQSLAAGAQRREQLAKHTRTEGLEDTREQRAVNSDERAARAEDRAIAAAELAREKFNAKLEADGMAKGMSVGTATKPEMAATALAMEEAGITPDFLGGTGFWSGDDDEGFAQLQGRLAQHAKQAVALRKEEGEQVQIDQVMRDTANLLKQQTFMASKDGMLGDKMTDEFDVGAVDAWLDSQLQSIGKPQRRRIVVAQ